MFSHEKIYELHPEVDRIEDNPLRFLDIDGNEVDVPQSSIDEATSEFNNTQKENCKIKIDYFAGQARNRFIPKSDSITEEYNLVLAQTKEWRANGSPSDDIPDSITSWAQVKNTTAELTAQAIEQQAAFLQNLLITIRTIRLNGKAAVESANGNFETVAQLYIDQLNSLQPPG